MWHLHPSSIHGENFIDGNSLTADIWQILKKKGAEQCPLPSSFGTAVKACYFYRIQRQSSFSLWVHSMHTETVIFRVIELQYNCQIN